MEKDNHHGFSGDFETFYKETPKYEESGFEQHRRESLSKKQIAAIGTIVVAAAAALAGLFAITSKIQSGQKTTAPAVPSAVTPQ